MRRPNVHLVVDAAALVAFVMLTSTGVLLRQLLPPGSGHRTTLWQLDRHDWGEIHFWISMAFFAFLSIHVLLHRHWIVSVVRGRPREGSALRVIVGLVGLAALLAAAFAPFFADVERAPAGERHRAGSSTTR